jgi:hypothetical protein
MSTIAFQALGFFMLPFNTQNLFTARSEQTIRRTQIFMPLYMFMFPFLVIVAYYQIGEHTHLHVANDAFMAAAVDLLPGWVLGLVAAAASLSGLPALAGISLAIGPLVSRNLIGHLPERQQRNWGQVVIAGYLMISIFLTLAAPTLLTTVINTAFFGITQFFPGTMAIMFVRKVNPIAIAVGIIVADVLSILFYSWAAWSPRPSRHSSPSPGATRAFRSLRGSDSATSMPALFWLPVLPPRDEASRKPMGGLRSCGQLSDPYIVAAMVTLARKFRAVFLQGVGVGRPSYLMSREIALLSAPLGLVWMRCERGSVSVVLPTGFREGEQAWTLRPHSEKSGAGAVATASSRSGHVHPHRESPAG